ncbi:MAG TPA: class I SAM-dependent methyltransferase [Acidimicrobiales bacterium]|nr:class I SAM-dependent methyltransferase [Acidimicrobiales bacterium]
MSDLRNLTVTPELVDYAVAHGSWLDGPVERRLRDETRALGPVARMQIGADEGQLLTLLTRLVGAHRAVEVGTFTGYSALCIARGLAPDGLLTCCDVSEEWTAIGRRTWAAAGVDDRIDLRLAPAVDTLRALPAREHVDLAFIDADKVGYAAYWAELVPRVRAGGLLVVDNVLYGGDVVNPGGTEVNARALQDFNDEVAADDRVDVVILPAFDGLTLARKR